MDFSTGGSGIEPLNVAFFASFVTGFDIHLDEIGPEQSSGEVTEFAARSDGGHDGDDALGNKELRRFSDAADVFQAILVGEAEVGAEAGAQVVTIEDGGETALLVKDAFHGIGESGFAGTGKPAKPNDNAALAKERFLVATMEEPMSIRMNVHESRSGKSEARTWTLMSGQKP